MCAQEGRAGGAGNGRFSDRDRAVACAALWKVRNEERVDNMMDDFLGRGCSVWTTCVAFVKRKDVLVLRPKEQWMTPALSILSMGRLRQTPHMMAVANMH